MSLARTILFCIASAIAASVATFGLFVVYATIADAGKKPAHPRVDFSQFLLQIEAGEVDELAVSGRIYTFRVGSRTNETVGPTASSAEIASLRSSNPALPPPKITTGAL
jgi:hypothetical protein